MRGVILLGLVAAAVGCGRPAAPLTAGGRPVSYWLDELKKPDAKARRKAVRELGHVGPADPAAVPAVTGALRDKDAAVRREAALAVFHLGPAAKEAEPALSDLAAKDPDPAVRKDAAKALEKLRGG